MPRIKCHIIVLMFLVSTVSSDPLRPFPKENPIRHCVIYSKRILTIKLFPKLILSEKNSTLSHIPYVSFYFRRWREFWSTNMCNVINGKKNVTMYYFQCVEIKIQKTFCSRYATFLTNFMTFFKSRKSLTFSQDQDQEQYQVIGVRPR